MCTFSPLCVWFLWVDWFVLCMLYMELSYTGSLDQSTRASEHVTVQIRLPIRLPGWQVFDLLEWEHVTFRISWSVRLRLVLLIVSL